jgi:sulfite dehydrogenase (quinone) subunit SoeA
LRGAPNPNQWAMYAANGGFFKHTLPEGMHFMKQWNRAYLDFAKEKAWRQRNDPVQLALYQDSLQRFRLAAQGKTPGRQPPAHLRERVERHFDPLPFWYPPLEDAAVDTTKYPLRAITQRPMAMYHAWDSQNAWLRQIHGHNHLHVNPQTARAAGIEDGAWAWVESAWGKLRCRVRWSEAVEPGTVWTWNAIGKASGAWQLAPAADESRLGFLLNHLISERLGDVSNSDPLTGQAAWFDVRVRITPCTSDSQATVPQMQATPRPPGVRAIVDRAVAYFAGGAR